jgi:hypothetical protein
MLTFSRKGSATGSCNKQNNNVSAEDICVDRTEMPSKPNCYLYCNEPLLPQTLNDELVAGSLAFHGLPTPSQIKIFIRPYASPPII